MDIIETPLNYMIKFYYIDKYTKISFQIGTH